MLTVQNLTKTYGSTAALTDLSMTAGDNGITALLGRNGAGKSTAIRCILGLLKPDSGSVLWNGVPIVKSRPRVGYLAEEGGLYDDCPVLEQLTYLARIRGLSRADAVTDAVGLLTRMDVDAARVKKMPAKKLSKGNRRKVQLCAALLGKPELLVLDEPMSGLDPVNADLFGGIIRELVQGGAVILMSGHRMDMVEKYCDSALFLNSGRNVLYGGLRELLASGNSLTLHEIFVKTCTNEK